MSAKIQNQLKISYSLNQNNGKPRFTPPPGGGNAVKPTKEKSLEEIAASRQPLKKTEATN